MWDESIVRGAWVVGANYGAGKLCSYLGKTSYQTGRKHGGKFQSRDK